MSKCQKQARATTELARFEDIIEEKLSEFGSSFAVEEDFNDLKEMFKQLCTTLADQKLEIDSLNVKVTRNDLKISQLEDKVAVLTASVNAISPMLIIMNNTREGNAFVSTEYLRKMTNLAINVLIKSLYCAKIP